MSHAEIIEAYPELSEGKIQAVLTYASKALHNEVVIDIRNHGEREKVEIFRFAQDDRLCHSERSEESR